VKTREEQNRGIAADELENLLARYPAAKNHAVVQLKPFHESTDAALVRSRSEDNQRPVGQVLHRPDC
jgi:hypothetical protein